MTLPQDEAAADDPRLLQAIAEYLRRLDRGEGVDRDCFLKEHPACAEGLAAYFAAMDQIERMAGPRCAEQAGNQRRHGLDSTEHYTAKRQDPWELKKLPFTFGRYRVLRRLGVGGMATVYLAQDDQLDRLVALKIPLQDSVERDRKWLERFAREARTNIQHPNVCTIYDVGIVDSQPYICMAYVKGQPLAQLIDPCDPLPEREVAELVCTVALGMHAAHQAGVIHRDLKPANIMIDETGHLTVMDFGLARRIGGDGVLTSTGVILGTPAYLAPEQIELAPESVTHLADIYSLGVTCYELLTGSRPFEGTLAQILVRILVQPPEPPSRRRNGLHRGLEAICLRMMAKRPSERFQSMQEVVAELRLWLQHSVASAETTSELKQLRRQVRRLEVGGAMALGGVGLLELIHWMRPQSDSHADPIADVHFVPGSHAAAPHDGWHSPLDDLIPDHPSVQKADPHFGTPGHDRAFWEGQQSYADTCAIRCQEFILQQFTGIDFPEDLLVKEAKDHGWYSPGHGTSMQDVGNLLELHGVAVNRFTDANVFHLANELAQGHKVIIGVDSGQLWGQNAAMDSMLNTLQDHFGLASRADHAVVVSGIDTTDPHHVRVIISDPGDGKAVASYPLEQFLHAWEGSHFYMVSTQEAAPAHLPEMVHFDYSHGHLSEIADVPYEQFVEHFAHHPEEWGHVLDHFVDEHFSGAASAGHDHDHRSDDEQPGQHDHAWPHDAHQHTDLADHAADDTFHWDHHESDHDGDHHDHGDHSHEAW